MASRLAGVLSVLVSIAATSAGPVERANASLVARANAAPIMGGANFPDPSIIRVPAGWHLFSTNAVVNGKLIHIQRAFTPDWKTFTFYPGVDALPTLPSWAAQGNNPRVWAPDVVKAADGSFVMYYTVANQPPHNSLHCLSYATAKYPSGPFVDSTSSSFICPLAQGGAIDPVGFTDELNGGTRWLVYKIDGNSLGHGGACGNTVAPIVPTPIMLQQLDSSGTKPINSPIQILTNIPSDGPYIEAPSLTFLNGKYVLFFSSQCYQTDGYDVQYAVADRIQGPYVRKGRVLGTGSWGMKAPGGLDLAINGDHAVWHANFGGGRAAFTGSVSMGRDGVVSVVLS